MARLPETIGFRPFAVHLHHRHEWQLAHLERAASGIKDTVKSMIERQVLVYDIIWFSYANDMRHSTMSFRTLVFYGFPHISAEVAAVQD